LKSLLRGGALLTVDYSSQKLHIADVVKGGPPGGSNVCQNLISQASKNFRVHGEEVDYKCKSASSLNRDSVIFRNESENSPTVSLNKSDSVWGKAVEQNFQTSPQ
jgi:hypothetical protein